MGQYRLELAFQSVCCYLEVIFIKNNLAKHLSLAWIVKCLYVSLSLVCFYLQQKHIIVVISK